MSRNPEEIRDDIERTRGNLGADVDAIADKVSPSNIAHRQGEKIKGTARRAREAVMGGVESASDEAGDKIHDAPATVVSKTRGNPMAAGLIAFGAGLLLSSLVPGSEKEREMVHTLKDKAEPLGNELGEAAKSIADDLKEPATEAVEAIKDSAQESAETIKTEAADEADHLRDQGRDAAANVSDSGGTDPQGAGPGSVHRPEDPAGPAGR